MLYRFRVDQVKGILFSYSFGNWTGNIAERYVQDLLGHAEQMRQHHGRLRLVADSRKADLPGDDVMRAFEGVPEKLIQSPADRIANIVSSNIWKQRTRRTYSDGNISAFLSESSAMSWLMGYMPNQSFAPVQMAR